MNPAPNQMNDGYEAADSMLKMEYEDRNGCAYTEEDTQGYAEKDVCPTCGADDCDGKCDEPDEDMDGDHASALASAGFGTDEDYEHNLYDGE